MKGFNNLIDVWFAFDVALNFRTGFVDHGVMVMDQRKIAKVREEERKRWEDDLEPQEERSDEH